MDTISEGTHDRFIIDAAKFNAKIAAKSDEFSPKRNQ
jgi:predicted thioesterase